jgi:hypothetical protein
MFELLTLTITSHSRNWIKWLLVDGAQHARRRQLTSVHVPGHMLGSTLRSDILNAVLRLVSCQNHKRSEFQTHAGPILQQDHCALIELRHLVVRRGDRVYCVIHEQDRRTRCHLFEAYRLLVSDRIFYVLR